MFKLIAKKKFEEVKTGYDSLFKIDANLISGESVNLGKFAADNHLKAVMVVNVASACGLTDDHYKQLKELHEKYKDQGFDVWAFPCNQFMGQEKASNEEICTFAKKKYAAKFTMFEKIDVNGAATHEVFKYCRVNSPLHNSKTGQTQQCPWNFTKFLIDKEGKVAGYYHPKQKPFDAEKQLKDLLA